MEIIKPLRTIAEFRKEFDNGGYFWNLWSHKNDGVITSAELSRVAGTLDANRDAILRFELLRGMLQEIDARLVLGSLDPEAWTRWMKYKPVRCTVGEALALPTWTSVLVEATAMPAGESEGAEITHTWISVVGEIAMPITAPVAASCRFWRLDDGGRIEAPVLLAVTPKSLDLTGQRLAIAAIVHSSATDPAGGGPRGRCLMGITACPI
jgi:hypothetical protein